MSLSHKSHHEISGIHFTQAAFKNNIVCSPLSVSVSGQSSSKVYQDAERLQMPVDGSVTSLTVSGNSRGVGGGPAGLLVTVKPQLHYWREPWRKWYCCTVRNFLGVHRFSKIITEGHGEYNRERLAWVLADIGGSLRRTQRRIWTNRSCYVSLGLLDLVYIFCPVSSFLWLSTLHQT